MISRHQRMLLLGGSSILFQGATFFLIAILKAYTDDESFAFFLVQLGWASILGSVGTLQLEVLLYQHFGRLTAPVLIAPAFAAVLVISVLFGLISGGLWLANVSVPFTVFIFVLAIAFSLHEVQTFLCVQQQKFTELFLWRAFQALNLLGIGLLVVLSPNTLAAQTIVVLYGLAILVVPVAWLIKTFLQSRRDLGFTGATLTLRDFQSGNLLPRGASLAFSILVNALYVNIPVLVASATQSSVFTADFGFILKLLTGPITLIRQTFGRLFFAHCLEVDVKQKGAAKIIRKELFNTQALSGASFFGFAVLVVPLVFFFQDSLQISNPVLVLYLVLASTGQALVNPVASIRTILGDEWSFLLFDIMRTGAMILALMLLQMLQFHIVFSVVSCILYLAYIRFIYWRLSKSLM